jgi:biotin carboxylase
MRDRFAAAGPPGPTTRNFRLDADPVEIAAGLDYPVVVKPTCLNGSRGVIRADGPAELVAAFTRTRQLLLDLGYDPDDEVILIESFIPGFEVAVEGLMTNGRLRVLALFDKPDPLDGPYFEETIYVTPSRLPARVRAQIARTTKRMALAVGVRHGPVHAELRVNDEGVWPIEVAGRSIGGMCSTVLEFGSGMSLEELILRHALGLDLPKPGASNPAVGVMMIPIPTRGMFRGVRNQEEALAVPGVTGIEITAPTNAPIIPLPEGASYLGFIFARGSKPADVEASLRLAHDRLETVIEPMLSLTPT